jgi:hypothetical protein
MQRRSLCVVNKAIQLLAVGLASALLADSFALAQSITPMRQVVRSFANDFAVRVTVGNPYPRRVAFEVKVYDETFKPIAARINFPVVKIAANDTRMVTVVVPFNENPQRKIRICAEGLFGADTGSKVRTQVCGRFLAQHVGF